jgi:Zn-finger protein
VSTRQVIVCSLCYSANFFFCFDLGGGFFLRGARGKVISVCIS